MTALPAEMKSRAIDVLQTLSAAERTASDWQTLRVELEAMNEALEQNDAMSFDLGLSLWDLRQSPTGSDDTRGKNTWDKPTEQTAPPPVEVYDLINNLVHSLSMPNAAAHPQKLPNDAE